MGDTLDDPDRLVRDVQTIGDAVLPQEGGDKLPFWKIAEVEEHLTKHYEGLIESESREGTPSVQIMEKLLARIQAATAPNRESQVYYTLTNPLPD